MDIDELRLFSEVVRAGSFAAVARRTDADPSAVSRAIARLEDSLGTRLFHRSTRSLRLTEAGQRFAERIDTLLEDFDNARHEALQSSEVPAGLVRLTASVGFSQERVVPLLGDLHRQYERLRIELIASDANLDLAAEGIDLALRLASRPEGDFIATRLRRTTYRVVASPEFAEAHRLTAPDGLAAVPCLCFALTDFRTQWRFKDKDGRETSVAVTGPIQASTSLALRELARRGLGASLLGDWLIDADIAGGTLVDLFPEHRVTATEYETGVWLLYPSRRHLPAKTRAVADFLRQRLAGDQTAGA